MLYYLCEFVFLFTWTSVGYLCVYPNSNASGQSSSTYELPVICNGEEWICADLSWMAWLLCSCLLLSVRLDLPVCLPVRLSVCPFYPSLHLRLSVHPSVCRAVVPPNCLLALPSVRLLRPSVSLPVPVFSVCVHMCPFTYLFDCLSLAWCPSICLPVHLFYLLFGCMSVRPSVHLWVCMLCPVQLQLTSNVDKAASISSLIALNLGRSDGFLSQHFLIISYLHTKRMKRNCSHPQSQRSIQFLRTVTRSA